MVAAPAAGLVEMDVLACLRVVLICLARVSTRLPWVLDKVTASVKKEFGPSAVYGKSNRAADLLCGHLLALVHSAVEKGEVLGVEFAGDEVGVFWPRFQKFPAGVKSILTSKNLLGWIWSRRDVYHPYCGTFVSDFQSFCGTKLSHLPD